MKIGLAFVNSMVYASPEMARELAVAADELGFDSLWTVEHIFVPAGYESVYPYNRAGRMVGEEHDDIADPLVWLAWVAAQTTRVLLGTGVLILPLRHPALLAKQAATVQNLSGGRLQLGVGSGWLAEEFAALDVPFDDRGARTDDSIKALRALWEDDVVDFQGDVYSITGGYSRPRPEPPIPIIVGGHSVRAARRAGELGDGFFPGRVLPDELGRLLDRMKRSAEAVGRDPDTIELSLGARPDPAAIEQRFGLGADRVIVPAHIGPDGLAILARQLGLGTA